MKNKYIYKYCVYLNNMGDGVRFVAAFGNLSDALREKDRIQYSPRGGCCDVVKKRFIEGAALPKVYNIANNYKYR